MLTKTQTHREKFIISLIIPNMKQQIVIAFEKAVSLLIYCHGNIHGDAKDGTSWDKNVANQIRTLMFAAWPFTWWVLVSKTLDWVPE